MRIFPCYIIFLFIAVHGCDALCACVFSALHSARRTTIREGPISALGQNYTLLGGHSDFVMSFTISVLNEDGMPCPEACDPRNMIRLFFPGPVAGGIGISVTGNGTARIFYTIVGFFRRVVPNIEALMRTVQITSNFVATE